MVSIAWSYKCLMNSGFSSTYDTPVNPWRIPAEEIANTLANSSSVKRKVYFFKVPLLIDYLVFMISLYMRYYLMKVANLFIYIIQLFWINYCISYIYSFLEYFRVRFSKNPESYFNIRSCTIIPDFN